MATATYIRIEGDYAEVVREEVIGRTKADDLMAALSRPDTDPGHSTGILPPGTRAMVEQNGLKAYFVEEPPTVRTLTFVPTSDSRGTIGPEGAFKVEVPRTLWLMSFEGTALGDPMVWWIRDWNGINTPLLTTVFPNQGEGGDVCLGTSFRSDTSRDMAYRIVHAIGYYWASSYNRDLPYLYDRAVTNGFSLPDWVAATERGEGCEYALGFVRTTYACLNNALTRLYMRSI